MTALLLLLLCASKCFRFASSFTSERCSEVGGVVVNASSSQSSAVPPPLAVTAPHMICYHNVCDSYMYVVDTSCFQHRSAFNNTHTHIHTR